MSEREGGSADDGIGSLGLGPTASFGFVATAPPPRRRRRGLRWAVVVVVVLFLGGGLIAGDVVARQLVTAGAQQAVIAKFGSDSERTTVSTSGWSMLAQLVSGRFDRIEVVAPEATVSDFSGDVTLEATGVPVDLRGAVTRVSITAELNELELQQLVQDRAGAPLSSATVTLEGTSLQVASSIAILGVEVPVTAAVTPMLDGQQLGFRVDSLTIGSSLRLPAAATAAVQSQIGALRLCLASSLPAGLEVSALTVHDGLLRITAAGRQVDLFSGAKGSCS